MRLYCDRFGLGRDSTLGEMYLPEKFACHSLEDERRIMKVPGETCIPEGIYRLTLRTVGGFHNRYMARFPEIHRGMLWLMDVPDFEYVLIHCGNDDDDTAGCILVGETGIMKLPEYEFEVHESVLAYKRIYPYVAEHLFRGGHADIEVRLRQAA